MVNYAWFVSAALLEIAGCYAFWIWLRQGQSGWWLLPAMAALAGFAAALTRVDAEFAGRAFAAYGGIYIASSLGWLMLVERTRPLLSDVVGALLCIAGATVILFGARTSA